MALTPEEREEIREDIIIAVKAALNSRRCACRIDTETQQEMGHFFGRLRDLGKGNLNEGVEIFGRAISTMNRLRRGGEKVGGAVAVFLGVTAAGGILTLLVWGAKAWVKMCIRGE
jgi:hypothetical protein